MATELGKDRVTATSASYFQPAVLQRELSPADIEKLERFLRNETDMCFRRRAFHIYDYLQLKESDLLFDCGCGRGFFTNMTTRLVPCKVVGLELEHDLLMTARAQVTSPNAAFSCGDITKLPFRDGVFDKVMFTEVLEHIDHDRRALEEIKRVMKPGAIAAVTVPNKNYPFFWDPINRVLDDTLGKPIRKGIFAGIWANHVRLYSPDQLASVAEAAGFEILEMRPITYFTFPFAHNIVYGFGKELLLAGWLPKSISRASDRFTFDSNSGSMLNPVNLLRSIFLLIDRLNEVIPVRHSSVNISIKLRRP